MEQISIDALKKLKKAFEKVDKQYAKALSTNPIFEEKIDKSKKMQKIWDKVKKWNK